MIKRTLLLVTLAAVLGTTVPQRAGANYDCAVGRITSVTGNSISVYDKEDRTFTVDSRTRYTSWPTRGRWQEIALLDPQRLFTDSRLLEPGRLVAIHTRHDSTGVARWVQVAVDEPYQLAY
jgi:hypothetical protein